MLRQTFYFAEIWRHYRVTVKKSVFLFDSATGILQNIMSFDDETYSINRKKQNMYTFETYKTKTCFMSFREECNWIDKVFSSFFLFLTAYSGSSSLQSPICPVVFSILFVSLVCIAVKSVN